MDRRIPIPRWLLPLSLLAPLVLGTTVFAQTSSTAGHSAASTSLQCPPLPRPPKGRLHPGPGPHGWTGTVSNVSTNAFSLVFGSVTYHVETSSTTQYEWAPGWPANASALANGEPVLVQGSRTNSQVAATHVVIQLPRVQGQVTALQGDTLTVQEPSGRTATLALSTSPTVQIGQTVQAVGTWSQDTLSVRAWRVLPAHLDGVIQALALGQNRMTVADPTGHAVTVVWQSTTIFHRGPHLSANASELAVGESIHATGQWGGGAFEASTIQLPPPPPTLSTPR